MLPYCHLSVSGLHCGEASLEICGSTVGSVALSDGASFFFLLVKSFITASGDAEIDLCGSYFFSSKVRFRYHTFFSIYVGRYDTVGTNFMTWV